MLMRSRTSTFSKRGERYPMYVYFVVCSKPHILVDEGQKIVNHGYRKDIQTRYLTVDTNITCVRVRGKVIDMHGLYFPSKYFTCFFKKRKSDEKNNEDKDESLIKT